MAYTDVAHDGYVFPDTEITWKLAVGTVIADVGKPVTIFGNNTVRVSLDNDIIHGRLMLFEYRTGQGLGLVGTISHQYTANLPALAGHGLVAGDQVVGAAAPNSVKKAGVGVYGGSLVAAVVGNIITVIKI